MIPKDPMILLSYVNTQLRDQYPTLEDFCKGENADPEELKEKLASVGCVYNKELNQFR